MKHTRTGDVMVDDVVVAHYATSFKEVTELLADRRISGLPVTDEDDKVIGVISETDLLAHQAEQREAGTRPSRWTRLRKSRRRATAKARARTAGTLMSTPAITVRAESTVTEAARTMIEHRVERLPVVDEEDRLVGIVTRRDVLRVFLRPDEEIRRSVIDEVLVRTLWLAPRLISVDVHEGVVTLDGQLERRSETAIAVGMTSRMDGVVGVVDKLTYRLDDSRLRPDEQALRGVTDDWLHKL
ncbi:CBS domain-containing protein [Streptomyces sp. SID8379]|uniref:CBS domain-containing protein n=1 Tax=unclassified Streptomyces TaxID=2593676 RepID=UPI00037AC4AA|nr:MULTISPECIES: CBS domain-containing protein [unclassified Streptomyces]MYW69821.1 CBS domain-containing protein [Streptomyces sp. SID8379]